VHADPHEGREARERLIDRVVDDLENAVMQPALVGVADVHVGALSHALQPLELLDFGRIVVVGSGLGFGQILRFGKVGHVGGKIAGFGRRKLHPKTAVATTENSAEKPVQTALLRAP
jgi:hypothetical protein